jgi:hypothetical protein
VTPLERQAFEIFGNDACCLASDGEGCCDECFRRWLRARLMEHWRGDTFWRELDRDDFGLFAKSFHPDAGLVADVVVLIMAGHENLTILTWALETNRSVDHVVEILTVLDINARRIPRFPWMVAKRAVV